MKFSTVDTAKGMDMMLAFLPHVSKIIEDAKLTDAKAMLTGKKSAAELAAKLTPLMLTDHRADLLNLVAVMQGTTAEKVAEQPITETMETFSEGVRLYAAFFPAALHLAANA